MADANRTLKAGRWTYTSQELDRMGDEAGRRGAAALRTKPRAISVRYEPEAGQVRIDLNNGCTLVVPTQLLQGLRDAAPKDLKQVQVMGPGLAIEWPRLDMQFTIEGLLAGVFGTKAWMAELGHRRSKTAAPAKARKGRRPGRKEGRPLKTPVSPSVTP
jgi:hypothetical protein